MLVIRKGAHTMGISLEAEGAETPQSVQKWRGGAGGKAGGANVI